MDQNTHSGAVITLYAYKHVATSRDGGAIYEASVSNALAAYSRLYAHLRQMKCSASPAKLRTFGDRGDHQQQASAQPTEDLLGVVALLTT